MVSVYNVVCILQLYFPFYFLVLTVRPGALGVCTVRGEMSAFLHSREAVLVTHTYHVTFSFCDLLEIFLIFKRLFCRENASLICICRFL